MREILLEASKRGLRLFRNNVGLGMSVNGNLTKYGLCKGSSDLIGITPVEITQAMVGDTIGIFTAIECKSKHGKLTKEQKAFLDMIESLGGIAIVARRVEDLDKICCNYK